MYFPLPLISPDGPVLELGVEPLFTLQSISSEDELDRFVQPPPKAQTVDPQSEAVEHELKVSKF